MYSLNCNYYDKKFISIEELIQDIMDSGMDPNYEITFNGKKMTVGEAEKIAKTAEQHKDLLDAIEKDPSLKEKALKGGAAPMANPNTPEGEADPAVAITVGFVFAMKYAITSLRRTAIRAMSPRLMGLKPKILRVKPSRPRAS